MWVCHPGTMQLPQWLARFNRHVTNPVQRLWAGWAPTMGILEHVGRRSGRRYRTPLTVFSTADGVAVLLTYGPNRDWLKNVAAADGADMRRYGRTLRLARTRDAVAVVVPEFACHTAVVFEY